MGIGKKFDYKLCTCLEGHGFIMLRVRYPLKLENFIGDCHYYTFNNRAKRKKRFITANKLHRLVTVEMSKRVYLQLMF